MYTESKKNTMCGQFQEQFKEAGAQRIFLPGFLHNLICLSQLGVTLQHIVGDSKNPVGK